MGGGGGQEAGVSEPFFTMNPNLKFCFFRGGGEGATVSLFFQSIQIRIFFFFFFWGGGGGRWGAGWAGGWGARVSDFFFKESKSKT